MKSGGGIRQKRELAERGDRQLARILVAATGPHLSMAFDAVTTAPLGAIERHVAA